MDLSVTRAIADGRQPLESPPLLAGALHVRPDLEPFIDALCTLGVDPEDILLTGPPYSFDEDTAARLEQKGLMVDRPRQDLPALEAVNQAADRILAEVSTRLQETTRNFVILEDGGYFVPMLHSEHRMLIPRCSGAVEQTTNGIARTRSIESAAGLEIPVASIPDTWMKKTLEPPYIADAAVRNIQIALNESGKTVDALAVGLIGFGDIGEKVASALRTQRAQVRIADKSFVKSLAARIAGFETVNSVDQLVGSSNLLIGATGSVMDPPFSRKAFRAARSGTMFASVSSKQVEFDMKYLRDAAVEANHETFGVRYQLHGKDIFLLNNGHPVNFQSTFSLPLPMVDLVYAMMVTSFHGVCTDAIDPGVHCIVDEEEIAKSFLEKYYDWANHSQSGENSA